MLASITRITLSFLLSSSLLLAGCGFHLRGKIDVPDSLMRLHVKGTDVELVHDVGKSLKFSDIEIVAEGDSAALLDLSNTTYVKEVNGTTSSGIASSYKMTYTANYAVFDAEGEALQKDSVKQSRTLSYDAANILVFEREEEFLKEEMRQELVNFIIRRMGKIQ
ncbi:MAG: hypothetical protein GY697_12220 [Desulfobacterales bacterium]|nr:hypothetical protein [Desulfobacterales bacterium]